MSEQRKNPMSGALMIIFGLILLAFPWFGLWTVSAIAGFVLIMIAIGLLLLGISTFGASKGAGIAFLILGILGLIAGIGLFGNVSAFAFLASLALYMSGAILIIAGFVGLFQKEKYAKPIGIIGIVLGVFYIILGYYTVDPRMLSILMGIWLIIIGIGRLR